MNIGREVEEGGGGMWTPDRGRRIDRIHNSLDRSPIIPTCMHFNRLHCSLWSRPSVVGSTLVGSYRPVNRVVGSYWPVNRIRLVGSYRPVNSSRLVGF